MFASAYHRKARQFAPSKMSCFRSCGGSGPVMLNPIFECASVRDYTDEHENDVVTGLLDNFYAVPRNLLEWCSGGVEPALQPQYVKCYLDVGDGLGVFEIAAHDLPDLVEPVVERVLMDEEFGGHVGGM